MTTQDMINAIDKLDLRDIQLKLTMPNEEGGFEWPEKETQEAIGEYREFLKELIPYMQDDKRNEVKPSPSMIVDIVWHTHILFTLKYHKDCDEIFGHYVHHQPIINKRHLNA